MESPWSQHCLLNSYPFPVDLEVLLSDVPKFHIYVLGAVWELFMLSHGSTPAPLSHGFNYYLVLKKFCYLAGQVFLPWSFVLIYVNVLFYVNFKISFCN